MTKEYRLFRKSVRAIIQLLGGLGAGLAILVVIGAWQLSSGPISLAFLSPYIESTLGRFHKSFRLRLDDTILTWAGWERTLDIRVVNVRAYDSDDALIAIIPELSLSLSAKALFQGMVAPRSIELFRPRLRVLRHTDGTLEVGFDTEASQSSAFMQRMVGELMAAPDPSHAMSYLSNVTIYDADLTVMDQSRNISWDATNAQVQLNRESGGFKGDVTLDMLFGGQRTNISMIGDYRAKDGRLDLGVDFSAITPAALSDLSPDFAALALMDLPVQGTLTFSMDGGGHLESLGFDLNAGEGHMAIPVKTAQKIGMLSLAQRIPVKGVELRGHFEGRPDSVEINNLTVDLGPRGTVYLPYPVSHNLPLHTVNARGRWMSETNKIEVDALEMDLQGPKASVALNVLLGDGDMSIGAGGVLRDMPPNSLNRYWPTSLGAEARDWVLTHISDGMVPRTRASVQVHKKKDGALELVSLSGDMDIDGVTIDYLPPMPKAMKTSGTARFTDKKFDIFVTRSESEGLTLEKAIISLSGLDKEDQDADIDLFIKGPVKKAMQMIEHEPLGFSSVIGIDPERTGGEASLHLKLKMPLLENLTLDQVDVTADAGMKDVFIDNVILGQGISSKFLDIKVNRQGLDIEGDVKLGAIAASLNWRRNFGDGGGFRKRFDIRSQIDDIRNLGDLGLNISRLYGNFIEGGVGADIRLLLQDDNTGKVRLKLDLNDVAFNVPAMNWSKQTGVGGSAQVDIDVEGIAITDIPNFSLMAGDLRLNGSAHYGKDGSGLDKVNINQVSYKRTNLAGVVFPGHDGGWTVSFHGPSLDLEPMFDDLFKSSPQDDEESIGLNLSVSAKVDKVWIGADRYVQQITGTFARADDRWRGIVVDGVVGEGKQFEVRLKPGSTGNRDLSFQAEDAGLMLSTLGIYDNLVGGTLDITGKFDDADPDHPLTGRLLISDYRIIGAPALAHLVSILSLTGIYESLQGDGLAFNDFDVPFVLNQGVIDIKDAKATGLSLGYTAKGRIYTHAEIVDIEGTVVPAYALNSVLGNIPILGTLLTGTEEGGGIFAANYAMRGTIENPKVVVNPLSALAPGIFRNLFGLLADGPNTGGAPPVLQSDIK